MCDPVTAALVMAGGSYVTAKGEKDAQNTRSAYNRQSAVQSMNTEQEAEQQRFEEENRAAVQEAYEASLEGRQGMAVMVNQAADSGVMGTSVNEGLFSAINTEAKKGMKFQQEMASRKTGFNINMQGLNARTANQINSVPQDNSNPLFAAAMSLGQSAASGSFDGQIQKKGT